MERSSSGNSGASSQWPLGACFPSLPRSASASLLLPLRLCVRAGHKEVVCWTDGVFVLPIHSACYTVCQAAPSPLPHSRGLPHFLRRGRLAAPTCDSTTCHSRVLRDRPVRHRHHAQLPHLAAQDRSSSRSSRAILSLKPLLPPPTRLVLLHLDRTPVNGTIKCLLDRDFDRRRPNGRHDSIAPRRSRSGRQPLRLRQPLQLQ